jgi:hypothetical protein
MHPNALRELDVVEVRIDEDITFIATIQSKSPKVCAIEPENGIVFPQRFCHYSQILRVISRPSVNDEKEAA